MFSLFDSLLANEGARRVTFQNNQKIEKVSYLRFYNRFFNFFTELILPGCRVLWMQKIGGKTCF